MRKASSSIGPLEPHVISYSSAISACEKSRSSDEALGLMQEMRLFLVEMDVAS